LDRDKNRGSRRRAHLGLTLRTAFASLVLAIVLGAVRKLHLPHRTDYIIIGSITFCHMIPYAALMTISLKYIPAGRAIVLGYTTPTWVSAAAPTFLNERMPG
jgi:drug/metabolite transporter (DMT)-like permease